MLEKTASTFQAGVDESERSMSGQTRSTPGCRFEPDVADGSLLNSHPRRCPKNHRKKETALLKSTQWGLDQRTDYQKLLSIQQQRTFFYVENRSGNKTTIDSFF